jgi:hypothetical protein
MFSKEWGLFRSINIDGGLRKISAPKNCQENHSDQIKAKFSSFTVLIYSHFHIYGQNPKPDP